MKKLALLLLLAFTSVAQAEVIGNPNQVACNQLIFQSASTASLTTLVAGVAGKTIFICGWDITNSSVATPTTFQLSQGTGTNCATTNTNITPAYSVANSAPNIDHTGYASLSLPIGANLCIISGTTTLQPGIWVGQY